MLGNGGINPSVCNLNSSWGWVASFTFRRLYPRGKGPRYPLDRIPSEPHGWSGCGVEKKKHLLTAISRNPTPVTQSGHNTHWATPTHFQNFLRKAYTCLVWGTFVISYSSVMVTYYSII